MTISCFAFGFDDGGIVVCGGRADYRTRLIEVACYFAPAMPRTLCLLKIRYLLTRLVFGSSLIDFVSMISVLASFFLTVRDLLRSRAAVQPEVLAPRQRLQVLNWS